MTFGQTYREARAGNCARRSTHIPNYSYLDLAANWGVTGHVQVRAGVNNVLDKDPPFLAGLPVDTPSPLNKFPAYDIVGREVFLALRATF